jgi:acetyl esterase/lipase
LVITTTSRTPAWHQPSERRTYGRHPDQFGDLYRPDGDTRGYAILIHGGFWRDGYGSDLMIELAEDLAARGWIAWNLEYRRLGSGGGWPATFRDVTAGIGSVADDHPIVAIGHSAGGHLALWAAAEGLVSHAVAQAGVVDLAEASRLGLSENAALELVGGREELFAQASPAARLPLGAPQLLVHGDADEIVPVAMSRSYHAAAVATGDPVELAVLPGLGHFEHLDPSSAAWEAVLAWLP